ncbi:PREDICTED: uncharacterized protein LOC109175489 [Ipomoea nil]|uniref:uncharacterized protein LOC109175489 n=1 Tax=Ipomoea nil TaxID=35883 RepID=UPI0009014401|nr:PREDICTED: uncharacterized protein LOC109175489 [Ipomoea nil]
MVMDAGSPESDSVTGIALSFPVNDSDTGSLQSTPRLPRRLRRRLLEAKSPSTTAQDIEAKLRDAELRRQQFYEILSSKARTKLRSLTWSSSLQDEELGQRLEAKLSAAEQKRLSILEKVQKRLAKLDELRQAAKIAVEMRFVKQRDELGSKVESRVHQAEVNRMLLLKALWQRRAVKKERTAQLLRKRIIKERKYKESIQAAIYRKRAAAEKKRLGFLEADRSRARARVLQVRQVAHHVYSRREIERTKLKDQLAVRLRKAQLLRAEYLKHRRNMHSPDQVCSRITDHRKLLFNKLARCWMQFVRQRGTTFALAKAYADLKINGQLVKRMTFEQIASEIESVSIIQTTKALLDRLENRIIISQEVHGASRVFSLGNIDHLLKCVTFPSKGVNVDKTTQKCSRSGKEKIDTVKLPRYPVRVVLCAYMIFGHPDMVFIGNGQDENALAESAGIFVKEFDLLIKVILEWSIQSQFGETVHPSSDCLTFRSQLEAFDKAWCSFLYSFVMWKVKDAKILEKKLVRATCELEHSMLQACKQSGDHMPEMKALQKQVAENQKVLRGKLQQLAGEGGIKRLEHALHETRSRFADKTESSSLLSSSYPHTPSSGGLIDSSASSDAKKCDVVEDFPSVQHDGASLLKLHSSSSNQNGSLTPKRTQNFSKTATMPTENEILVNEIFHEPPGFDIIKHGFDIISHYQTHIKTKVRRTMDKAFWDGVIDSMKQNEPDYSWVLKLIKEVQDELCKMSPSWRQDIVERIDIDILSQMLNAGILDIDYLGRILEYSLLTLQKLCAPDDKDELKCAHQKLLQELADIPQAADKSNTKFALVVVQGLRFVLQQIQRLKRSRTKTRIRGLEPYIKGPAGVEYLRNAFSNRYGPPSKASASLPLVKELLSALISEFENDWNDHLNSLSALGLSNERYSRDEAPSTLRAGGDIFREPKNKVITSTTAGVEQPECKGDKVDLLVRLGLLKLVTEIEGLTAEKLPETLKLSFYRLQAAQSELHKIIVICISILVLRQTLLTEHLVSSAEDMETLIGKCVTQLYELVDNTEDAGISELVESMSSCLESDETEKSQARKEVVTNMLRKSLRAEDTVFQRISHAIRLATRGVLLGGSGSKGKKLAENALKRVGASVLTEKLVETGEKLLVVAVASASIHRAWYAEVLRNL